MADQLYNDFRQRGFELVHVLLEDGPDPDTEIGWQDAYDWAYNTDFSNPKDGIADPFTSGFRVVADTDGGLWSRYSPGCSGCGSQLEQLLCLNSCQVTTQSQILDQGHVTVYDPCSHTGGTCSQCTGGGYNDAEVRNVLNSILPVSWCGAATE